MPGGSAEHTVENTIRILQDLRRAEGGRSYGTAKTRSAAPKARAITKYDLIGAKSPQFLFGTVKEESRLLTDQTTLRGTWINGPPVEQIRRRVALDEESNGVIVDEVFLSYEKDFDWCAPLTNFPGYENGRPRNIKVILWYMEAPPRPDPSLPAQDPF